MSWRFELVGDNVDLVFISGLFPAHSHVRVLETDGRFALEADTLDKMTGDHVARPIQRRRFWATWVCQKSWNRIRGSLAFSTRRPNTLATDSGSRGRLSG